MHKDSYSQEDEKCRVIKQKKQSLMNLTDKQLSILKFYAQYTKTEDKYVILKEDEKGTYIEYAFIDGAPHDNRCLSWYDSLQPNAIRRNNKAFGCDEECALRLIELRKKCISEKIGNIFKLQSFTCGHEENLESELRRNEEEWNKYHPEEPFVREDHICKVGCPSQNCVRNKTCAHWTYEEPVKCACWVLKKITEDNIPTHASVPIDELWEYKNIYESISNFMNK